MRHGREIVLSIILLSPYLLLLPRLSAGKGLTIPKIPTVLYTGFLIFSLVATLLSFDIAGSLRYLLLYVSLYGIFLYCYNSYQKIRRVLPYFIISISALYVVYSVFLPLMADKGIRFVIPQDGYQFVFAAFGTHNHRGDFIILAMIIAAYWFLEKRYQNFSLSALVIFLPFLLYSYSRSALVALVGGITLGVIYFSKKKRVSRKQLLPFIGLIIVIIPFFFLTVKEMNLLPFISDLRQELLNTTGVREKVLTSDRLQFWSQSFASMQQKPFFGIGPDQFFQMSLNHFSQMGFATVSSHNLFIDVFVENGIPAGICFVLFIGYIFWKAKKDLYFFLAFTMLINFQSDYSFKIYSFFFLFFCLLGIMHYNSEHERPKIQNK